MEAFYTLSYVRSNSSAALNVVQNVEQKILEKISENSSCQEIESSPEVETNLSELSKLFYNLKTWK